MENDNKSELVPNKEILAPSNGTDGNDNSPTAQNPAEQELDELLALWEKGNLDQQKDAAYKITGSISYNDLLSLEQREKLAKEVLKKIVDAHDYKLIFFWFNRAYRLSTDSEGNSIIDRDASVPWLLTQISTTLENDDWKKGVIFDLNPSIRGYIMARHQWWTKWPEMALALFLPGVRDPRMITHAPKLPDRCPRFFENGNDADQVNDALIGCILDCGNEENQTREFREAWWQDHDGIADGIRVLGHWERGGPEQINRLIEKSVQEERRALDKIARCLLDELDILKGLWEGEESQDNVVRCFEELLSSKSDIPALGMYFRNHQDVVIQLIRKLKEKRAEIGRYLINPELRILLNALWETNTPSAEQSSTDRADVVSCFVELVKSGQEQYTSAVIEWLGPNSQEISEENYKAVLDALQQQKDIKHVFELIRKSKEKRAAIGRYLIDIDHRALLNKLWETNKANAEQSSADRADVVSCFTELVKKGTDSEISEVIEWLGPKAKEIPEANYDAVIAALRQRKYLALLVQLVAKREKKDDVKKLLGGNSPDELAALGRYLINDPEMLNGLWTEEASRPNLVHCFAVLVKSGKGEEIPDAIDWLGKKADGIPSDSYSTVIEALAPSKGDKEKDRKNAALREITQYERKLSRAPLFKLLDEVDIDSQIHALDKLMDLKSRGASRELVDRWVNWLALGEKPLLVEMTSERLRTNSLAVLPLVDYLSKKLESSTELRKAILKQEIPTNFHPLIPEPDLKQEIPTNFHPLIPKLDESNPSRPAGKQDTAWNDLIQELLRSLAKRSDAFARLYDNATTEGWGNEKIIREVCDQLVKEELVARTDRIHERIVKQLADMSDERFFSEDTKGNNLTVSAGNNPKSSKSNPNPYSSMLEELKKQAVPVIAARLRQEANIAIRENSARLLGNVRDPEAINALVEGVVGEERTRTARQQLLSEYYLEPSKKQSDEAAEILRKAVEDARETLSLLRRLNVVVFAVGIALLVLGTTTSLMGQEVSTRVLGALAGLGGLTGILVEMVNSPLDRIQNAMANLVQIEAAFTSFIWELNLNGTYIQSQYVAKGLLADNDITGTAKRIESAMTLAMNQVSIYTTAGQQRIVSRLYDMEPPAGKLGSMLTVRGQHLTGDRTEKKEQTGIIHLNHVPTKVEKLKWKDQEVSFQMPVNGNGKDGSDQTVWISLMVDGMETNALPFHVIREGE